MLCKNNEVLHTLTSKSNTLLDFENKTNISIADVITAQTFPQDFDFIKKSFSNVTYVCGMSVPPIMIKRIVTRLIESKIFGKEIQ